MMIATGGVAFPDQCQSGMTLRDYFAAQALPGIITFGCPSDGIGTVFDMMAQDAYRFADAMLAERNKQ